MDIGQIFRDCLVKKILELVEKREAELDCINEELGKEDWEE